MSDKTQVGSGTKKHSGLMGAQQQACGMFEVVRGLERVRMRARDAGDSLMVERLSKAISETRDIADLFIDREHNPHARRSPYAPDDAVEAD